MSAVPAHTGIILTFLRELRATATPVIRLSGQGPWAGVLIEIETEARADPRLGRLLADWHHEAAEDLGGPELPFDEDAARQAAVVLFRAAWCYLHRDTPAAEVAKLLQPPPPETLTAAAQFSADLTLRHLPALHRIALALAPGDPLLAALRALAAACPLSSPGFSPDENFPPSADPLAWARLQEHPGLRQLFLDRVAAHADRAWMEIPDIAAAIAHALGVGHGLPLHAPATPFPAGNPHPAFIPPPS